MIFFCPNDGGGLQATGKTAIFGCTKCRCIFSVSVNITQMAGSYVDNDIRKQLTTGESPVDADSSPESDSVNGFSTFREG